MDGKYSRSCIARCYCSCEYRPLIGYRFDSWRMQRIPVAVSSSFTRLKLADVRCMHGFPCARRVFRDLAVGEGAVWTSVSRVKLRLSGEETNGWMVFLKIIRVESSSREGFSARMDVKGQLLLVDFFFFFSIIKGICTVVQVIGFLFAIV